MKWREEGRKESMEGKGTGRERKRRKRKEITEPGAQPFSHQRKLRQGFDGGLISALLSVSASLEWPLFMVKAILPARLLPLRSLSPQGVRGEAGPTVIRIHAFRTDQTRSCLPFEMALAYAELPAMQWGLGGGPSQHPCDRKTRCVLVSPVSQVLWEDGSWGRNARPSSLPALGAACHIVRKTVSALCKTSVRWGCLGSPRLPSGLPTGSRKGANTGFPWTLMQHCLWW